MHVHMYVQPLPYTHIHLAMTTDARLPGMMYHQGHKVSSPTLGQ